MQDIMLNFQQIQKLFGSTKRKITKDENGKNLPHLQITEVVLINRNNDSNNYQQDLRILYTIVSIKSFIQLPDI